MAVRAPLLENETKESLKQHQTLTKEIELLNAALEKLVCHSEVFADLSTAGQAYRCARLLAQWAPQHFRMEEATVFADAQKLGQEWAAFTREMTRQHSQMRQQLSGLCAVMERLQTTDDLESCICEMKEAGQKLTRQLAVHMSVEEHKYSMFSN